MTTKTNFFHALGAASLAVTLSTVTLIAAAGPVNAGTTARVSYADLDLGTSAGRAALNARVAQAAKQVCDATAGRRTLQDLKTESRCRQDAVSGAMPMIAAAAAPATQAIASAE
jgi:UrcA family protein